MRHFSRLDLPSELKKLSFPGSETGPGSGIPEVCERCSLNRERDAPDDRQRLVLSDEWETTGPSWPHERQTSEPACDTEKDRFKRKAPRHRAELDEAWLTWLNRPVQPEPTTQTRCFQSTRQEWPRKVGNIQGNERPTVSFLFSGGVFRGVYQVGVLNGLNELGLQPDLIAGASVGSITAAMIARAFTLKKDTGERAAHIARMASAYLAIDRLILTDRFADAVRNLTLRAAELRFSIYQADRVFRKYDYPSFFEFDRNTRRVLAGIERFLYVSPYQLNDIIRAARVRDNHNFARLVKASVQQFLDRSDIGEEALGAEALRALIEHFVIPPGASDARAVTTDTLRENGQIQFLATATNLTDGRLEVIGESPESEDRPGALLDQALLASSAFPAVFRPRWSWELSAGAPRTAQYVDGGVMDNLPMDAIARFLDRAARVGRDERAGEKTIIKPDPVTPHLIVGASLEVNAPTYELEFTRRRFRRSWLALQQRASQLKYNTKLDIYEFAERALRLIRDRSNTPSKRAEQLVKIELIAIKPNWLCGTFAFHPMLGFSRRKQARSIAHGCATTLLKFASMQKEFLVADPNSRALEDWGIPKEALPEHESWSNLFKRPRPPESKGACWLRDCACPFSRKSLSEPKLGLENTVIDQVSEIHRACPLPETHLRKI